MASNTLLFEAIVSTVHELLPADRLVSNAAAVTSPDDIAAGSLIQRLPRPQLPGLQLPPAPAA